MKRSLLKLSDPRIKADWIFDSLDVSETTRKDYSARIGYFLSYTQENGFNKQSCLQFKRYLEKSNYSVATKNKYLTTARVFIRELIRKGLLPFDTSFNVKQFRQSKRHKKEGLSDREIQLLGVKLKYLPDTPRNSRLRALFSLLAFQGLRQIEIVRLDVEDIDLAKKTAFVQGKGEDEKELIYLVPATVEALKKYLKATKLTSGALFKSMGNRGSDRLSTMTIKRELGDLLHEIGINKNVHGFRHFYVTELLKTMDVRDVRKFSRHRSLEMLIVYDDEVSMKEKTQKVFQVMEQFNFSR